MNVLFLIRERPEFTVGGGAHFFLTTDQGGTKTFFGLLGGGDRAFFASHMINILLKTPFLHV